MDGNDDERKNWTAGRASSTRRGDLSSGTEDRDSASQVPSRLFTSGMIAAASRPITQQGMTGLRPVQTSSGPQRQHRDRRYYTSQIQSHMASISEEINNLKKQLNDNKLDATNYEECKRQMEAYKKQLADHEESLVIYNTAIEISMNKGSKEEVDSEAEELRKHNQNKTTQLESLFSDKLAREEQLNKIRTHTIIEERLFDEMIKQLPEDQRTEYNELCAKNEQYTKDEERLRSEIQELKNVITIHEQHVVQNEAKRNRYNLLIKFHELSRRRDKILAENKVKRTPSQEREYLLEQVKQDRLDMESFRAQEEEYKIEIEKMRERLSDLEDELSEKNSARLNKYRELLKRQETMENFLGSFNEQFAEQVAELNEASSRVVYCLELLSVHSTDANIEDLENTKNYEVNPNATKDELKEEFRKLADQLKMANSINERFQKEIKSLKVQQEVYTQELKVFDNIDIARDDLIDRQQNLEAQRDSLKKVLQATKSAVSEAEKEQSELDNMLKYNDAFKQLNELEEMLLKLKAENDKQKAAMDNMKTADNYDNFKAESLNVVKDMLADLMKKASNIKL